MFQYLAALLVIFAVLVFLKFCEGSPFRSWKSVILTGLPVGLLAGYYLNHAFPQKPPPVPQVQKASAYRAEMERAWRRIAEVDGINIVGTTVQVNFADYKALPDVKAFARQAAGNASFFLKTNNRPIRVKVKISVRGKDRYELDYEPKKGVVDEQEFEAGHDDMIDPAQGRKARQNVGAFSPGPISWKGRPQG